MAGTRDVLDELAEWYSLPGNSTMAIAGATASRSPFVRSAGFETMSAAAQDSLPAILERLLVWHDRARQRRALLSLSDEMLGDIGISRTEALNEAGKAFWRN
jgi:uncharacterized protein YjiS (DUF1127 family)